MLEPLGSLDRATRVRDRLLGPERLEHDELHRLIVWTQIRVQIVSVRQQTLLSKLQPPPREKRYLDLSAWGVTCAAFLAAVADWFQDEKPSMPGWIGLVLGFVGLCICAGLYQLELWEREGAKAEIDSLIAWREILTDISLELERRLVDLRGKVFKQIS